MLVFLTRRQSKEGEAREKGREEQGKGIKGGRKREKRREILSIFRRPPILVG